MAEKLDIVVLVYLDNILIYTNILYQIYFETLH